MSKTYKTVFELGGQLDPTFKKSFNNATKKTDEVGKSLTDLQKKGKETQNVFSKLSKSVGGLSSVFGNVAQLTGVYALISGIADSLSNLAGSVFEEQDAMAQLAAATGASAAEMKELQENARSIYASNLGDSFSDITSALSAAKQVTQQQGKALEETTKNAIIYRDVFGEDITQSIKAADTMMKNFGITSDEAYNLLAQGELKGLDKTEELLDTANEYAVHFSSLGFSANQMFDVFSAGLESGAFNLDKVGDAVKEFNIRSKDMSASSIEAYQALGLNAEQMSQTFANGGVNARKAFTEIVESISSVGDETKKDAISIALFGTAFEDLQKNVITAMGSAQSQFDMTADTMKQIQDVKYSSVSKAFRGIGRQLYVEFIAPIGDWLLPHLNTLGSWFKSNIPTIKAFFGQVGNVIGTAFSTVKDVLGSVFTDAFGDGSASGMFDEFLSIKDQLLEGWSEVAPHFKNILGSIGKIFKTLSPTVLKVVKTIGQAAVTIYKSFIPVATYFNAKLYPVFSKVFGYLANDVAPAIARAFNSALPMIMTVSNKIGSAVQAIFNFTKPVLDALVGAFNFAFPVIKSVVMSAINAVSGVFNGLMTSLGGVLDFITGVFTGNWSAAWQGVKDVFGGIFSGLGSLLKAPINAVIGLINQAIGSINSISVDIPDWVPEWAGGGKSLGFSIPEIPMLATGGIATGPTLAMIGEGRESEAILPLSKLESMLSSPSYHNSTNSNDIYVELTQHFYISGTATQQDAERVARAVSDSFDKQINKWNKQRQRVVLNV